MIDPNRAENVISNDGTSMRIMAQTAAKPSAWTRQQEIIEDDRAESALQEDQPALGKVSHGATSKANEAVPATDKEQRKATIEKRKAGLKRCRW